MRKTVTIKLAEPLVGHDGPIRQIVLREPSFSEYLEFGDCFTIAGSNGSAFMVENPEIIRRYINTCMIEPKDAALLEQASAMVAKQVKEGVLSFFEVAAEASAASETSATTSASGASASAPANSAT